MSVNTVTLITVIIGTICGVTGAILGVINTWQLLQRNRIRLKIIPQHAILPGNVPFNFGVQVINLSDFPVIIVDVGLQLTKNRHGSLTMVEGIENNGKLPMRLDPHTAYSKIFNADQGTVNWGEVRCAYVRTQCDTYATGTSPALKQLIREKRR